VKREGRASAFVKAAANRKAGHHVHLDVLNGQNPYERVRFSRPVRDVYARPEGGQSNTATSEAEPHARRSEAEPR
jgi:hypothetical protein